MGIPYESLVLEHFLQLSSLEILRTVSSKVHGATLVVLQLSCLETLITVSSKVHGATLVVLQLSCLDRVS